MCPFCEWQHRPSSETPDCDRSNHITTFHRDRLRALAAYQAALAAGADEPTARRAHNVVLRHRGPGQYDRQPQALPA